MKQLYFVRHGQSEANVAEVYAGQTETPLTAEGRKQAKLAGSEAKKLKIDHIIASPLGRAHDTAKIIAKEIGFSEEQIELNSLLLERHYGSYEGKPWELGLDADIDGIVDIETEDSVMERGRLAYEHLLTLPYDNILVVSHGTYGRALRSAIDPNHPFEPGNENTRFHNAQIVRLI